MLYLFESMVGTGKTADPRRPIGSDQPGWSSCLLGNTGRGLLWLPSPSSNPALTLLAADKDDTLGPAVKSTINTKLGTSVQLSKASDVIAEILLTSGKGWPALKPTRAGYIEIYLNNALWYKQKAIKGGSNVSSTFSTTQNPVSEGGFWTAAGGSYWRVCRTDGSTLRATGVNDPWCVTKYAGSVFQSDHSSQVFVSVRNTTQDVPGAMTRVQSNGDGYIASNQFFDDTFMWVGYVLGVDGSLTVVATPLVGFTITVPYDMKMSSNGSVHSAYINGTLVAIITDSQFTGGTPGAFVFALNNVADCAITQWIGDDGLRQQNGRPDYFMVF